MITSNPARGLERFEDLDPAEPMPADCVIFGCAGLGRECVEWFEKFVESETTSQMPAILIVTDKVDRLAKPEWFVDHRLKLTLPIKFKHLQHGLRSLLNIRVQDANAAAPKMEREPTEPASSVNDSIQDTDVELG